MVEHRTRLLLLLLRGAGQLIITEEEILATVTAVIDFLLHPHSGVVVPFSSVFGEIRL